MSAGSNGDQPVGARVEEVIAATGLNYTQFSMALAGLDPYGPTLAKWEDEWNRMQSQRRQLRRWRAGEHGLEPATALRLVDVANRILEGSRRAKPFPLDYLVEAERPQATLERLDMKLDLILGKLEAIEERL